MALWAWPHFPRVVWEWPFPLGGPVGTASLSLGGGWASSRLLWVVVWAWPLPLGGGQGVAPPSGWCGCGLAASGSLCGRGLSLWVVERAWPLPLCSSVGVVVLPAKQLLLPSCSDCLTTSST